MVTKETKRKEKYEPKSDSKGGKLSITKRNQLLESLGKEVEKNGSVNKSEFARKNNISRKTVITLLNDLDVEIESLNYVKVEIRLIFDRCKNRALWLMDRLEEDVYGEIDYKNELSVLKEIQNIIANNYKMLQEIGDAPKVAEKLDIRGTIIHADLEFLQEVGRLE